MTCIAQGFAKNFFNHGVCRDLTYIAEAYGQDPPYSLPGPFMIILVVSKSRYGEDPGRTQDIFYPNYVSRLLHPLL